MTQLTTRDGRPVSRLTFGTMQFGGKADATASQAMFEAACAAGINHFDTAVGYNDGASEKLLSPMIKDDRDSYFVATKVGYIGGATRDNILKQFDRSRQQLQEDSVDLLYMHRFDDQTELKETFGTLAELQGKGLIRYIGVSNYAAWQVMKAQQAAYSQGTTIDAIQPMYSLVKRQAEVEILPMAQDQNIAAFPYSPLGGGLLTGKYANGDGGRLTEDTRYAARYGQPWMHDTAKALFDTAKRLNISPTTLAVAWAAARPCQPAPIISARSVTQLQPSLDAMEFKISDRLYADITALSPAPAPATDRLEEA
ncbi:aldo/keto reductase [Yoonia sp. 2307UL14-13]|uniref:aldo/keto reductase n=1 Tax=Yoonia sp. 2307UL14-13 TaxID=3126506 RepID=UPI0030A62A96